MSAHSSENIGHRDQSSLMRGLERRHESEREELCKINDRASHRTGPPFGRNCRSLVGRAEPQAFQQLATSLRSQGFARGGNHWPEDWQLVRLRERCRRGPARPDPPKAWRKLTRCGRECPAIHWPCAAITRLLRRLSPMLRRYDRQYFSWQSASCFGTVGRRITDHRDGGGSTPCETRDSRARRWQRSLTVSSILSVRRADATSLHACTTAGNPHERTARNPSYGIDTRGRQDRSHGAGSKSRRCGQAVPR